MALPPDRLDRFARHIVLPEVGGAGQVALTGAHVALVGCGGIGSPALQYLAAAGIGRLTLIDIGRPKAERAAEWVRRFDPALHVRAVPERVDAGNAAQVLAGADVVLDGCDNFATRLVVSDACVAAGIPLTSAAIGRFQGQVANFAGHLPGQSCYRCLVGDAFDADDCDTCAADGVLGAMAGMVGCFAAMHAMRVILAGHARLGDPRWGTLHLFDGLGPSLRPLTIVKDPACRGCSGR